MSERTKQFLKAQWDTLATLAAAVVLAVLSGLDVIDGQAISASTLAVLALLCGTIVKDRQARAADSVEAHEILAIAHSVDDRLRFASDVEAVAPPNIGRRFADAWGSATRWRFKGGTGTYLRAKNLPGISRQVGPAVPDVWIEVIAPDDVPVCETYGNHRRQQPWRSPSTDGLTPPRSATATDLIEPWSTSQVRIEAYATIIAAIWFTLHTRVRAHIALSSTMSTFRYDLSDDFVIITNEDPLGRALMVRRTSSFFASIERELITSFDQARQIDISTARLPRHRITPDDVRRVLRSLSGLEADESFLTSEVCAEIASKAISEDHAQELGFERGGATDPYPLDRPLDRPD